MSICIEYKNKNSTFTKSSHGTYFPLTLSLKPNTNVRYVHRFVLVF